MLYPQFGSVSTGTLRTEDLLESFKDELEFRCEQHGADKAQYADVLKFADEILTSEDEAFVMEFGSDAVGELISSLNDFAAPYSYFGSLPGDGADYGFWPDIDGLETAVFDGEVTKVNDPSEATEPGEYAMVNDHGNVTYGWVDDAGKFTTIWDCV